MTPRTSIAADDSIPVVSVPKPAFDRLVRVAAYISLGRHAVDHQPDGTPYPDAIARRALGELDDAGLLGEPIPNATPFQELSAQIRDANGVELLHLGQTVAIACIDAGTLDEGEFTALQNQWMARMRQFVGPEEALRYCGEAVHAAGKRPCTMNDIRIYEDTESVRSPGWYIARCDRLDCGWETSGAENICEAAAEAHVWRSLHPEDGE